jgi:hypothetical protein
MNMKLIILTGFIANILLSNFYMMPMAITTDVSIHHNTNVSEKMMTPMTPMSHADCEHCPHHEEKKESAPQSSSCAGHCLSQATSTNTSNVTIGTAQLLALLPVSTIVQWVTVDNAVLQPTSNLSPPRITTDKIVLRL